LLHFCVFLSLLILTHFRPVFSHFSTPGTTSGTTWGKSRTENLFMSYRSLLVLGTKTGHRPWERL
jgi:hypothetical protein